MRAADEGLSDLEGALSDDDGGHGALAGHHAGLDDRGAGRSLRIRLEFQHLGLQGHGFEKVVDALAGLGGNFHALDVTTPFHRHEADILELGLHAHHIRRRQVALVDGDHELHVGGLGVIQGLARLRHDAIVSGNDEDDDVGDIGAAGAHAREGGVTRGVDEGDRLALMEDGVGADVLSDAASLGLGDLGFADGVKKRGLAVVDVPHERDDRGAQLEFLLGDLLDHLSGGLDNDFLDLVDAGTLFTLLTFKVEAVFFADLFRHVELDGLVGVGDENLQIDKVGDDLEGSQAHLLGQVLDDDRGLEMDDLLAGLVSLVLGLGRLHGGGFGGGWRNNGRGNWACDRSGLLEA